MRVLILALVVMVFGFVSFGQAAYAQEKQKTAQIELIGAGSLTCMQWLEAEKDATVSATMESWAYGYFSAMNRLRAVRSKPQYDISRLNSNKILGWLDEFCPSYPDYLVAFALEAMIGKRIQYKQER